jgi:hypothetical protein
VMLTPRTAFLARQNFTRMMLRTRLLWPSDSQSAPR